MDELIRITKDDLTGQSLVSARSLYDFLEVRTEFLDWVKRMLDYGFTEGTDFNFLKKEEVRKEGGRSVTRHIHDWALTIDCAKEISMIQRTDKGKEARTYFIECERKSQLFMNQIPTSFADALRLAANLQEENEKQAKLLTEAQPKVDFFDQVADSKDAIDIGSAARVLNAGIGRNRLFEILRNKGVLMHNNTPYQKYIDMGWFRVIEQKYNKPDGTNCINIKTLVYQRGLQGILKILK